MKVNWWVYSWRKGGSKGLRRATGLQRWAPGWGECTRQRFQSSSKRRIWWQCIPQISHKASRRFPCSWTTASSRMTCTAFSQYNSHWSRAKRKMEYEDVSWKKAKNSSENDQKQADEQSRLRDCRRQRKDSCSDSGGEQIENGPLFRAWSELGENPSEKRRTLFLIKQIVLLADFNVIDDWFDSRCPSSVCFAPSKFLFSWIMMRISLIQEKKRQCGILCCFLRWTFCLQVLIKSCVRSNYL